MKSTCHFVDNGAGWEMALKQVYCEKKKLRKKPPVLIVPGYGMNAYIFGYHPNGKSLEEYLAESGFEVWSINLRGQEPSRCTGGSRLYTMQDVALNDLPLAVKYVLENTLSGCAAVNLLGCSLGGSMVLAYAALRKDAPVNAIVSLGSPLRWIDVHPAVKIAFSSPELIGLISVRRARSMARFALPFLAKIPGLLEIYMHPDNIDMSKAEEFIKTVEDPNRLLNREIAHWIKKRDLVLEGRNVTEEFRGNKAPFLCVIANADGIVPPATAVFPYEISGADRKNIVHVGNEKIKFAHADLYLNNHAQEMFFSPLVQWLKAL